jgi:hypothetical protein
VYIPCFSAFLLPSGAPDPGAPPCIRHRLFPLTAGELQDFPERVLAPQRALASIGLVLRRCLLPCDIFAPRLFLVCQIAWHRLCGSSQVTQQWRCIRWLRQRRLARFCVRHSAYYVLPPFLDLHVLPRSPSARRRFGSA